MSLLKLAASFVRAQPFCYHFAVRMERVNPHVALLAAHAAIAGCAAMLVRSALSRLAPRRCLGQGAIHLLPIACATVGVYLSAGATQALTLMTAAAVSAILFANGFAIAFRSPGDDDAPVPPPTSLVLPLAAILMLSGFSSVFTAASLIGLALVGLLGSDVAASHVLRPPQGDAPRSILLAGAAIVPALVIVGSSHQFSSQATAAQLRIGPDAFLVCVLAPLALFPLIGHATHEAARGRLHDALGITATFTLLLLGLCIPALVGADYLWRKLDDEFARPVALPAISWRLDASMLLAGGFALLGVRVGLLSTHRWIGMMMVFLYGAYLLLAAVLRIS